MQRMLFWAVALLGALALGCGGFSTEAPPLGPAVAEVQPGEPLEAAAQRLVSRCAELLSEQSPLSLDCVADEAVVTIHRVHSASRTRTETMDGPGFRLLGLNMLAMVQWVASEEELEAGISHSVYELTPAEGGVAVEGGWSEGEGAPMSPFSMLIGLDRDGALRLLSLEIEIPSPDPAQ